MADLLDGRRLERSRVGWGGVLVSPLGAGLTCHRAPADTTPSVILAPGTVQPQKSIPVGVRNSFGKGAFFIACLLGTPF